LPNTHPPTHPPARGAAPQLCGFGGARILTEAGDDDAAPARGAARAGGPDGGRASRAGDVAAFGRVLFEALDACGGGADELRPFLALAAECTSEDAETRPTMHEVLLSLDGLAAEGAVTSGRPPAFA
jgi:hypothetical protein